MGSLDWIILVAYCLLLIVVGLFFRRRAERNLESYFIAGRDLPWWVIGLSDSAAYTGGGQGFLMVFFLSGFAGLWLMAWVSWAIWMPLVAVIWARMWRRLGVVTTGELIERRYGGRPARLFRNAYAVYACLAWGLTVMAYVAAWMAATLAPVLGWSPGHILAVFGAVTLVYVTFSGFLAVAYNDVIQFALLMTGNTIFGLLLISHGGGFDAVWTAIAVQRGGSFLEPLPVGEGLSAASLAALCLQGLFFAGSPYAGEGWTAQRYMAARSERHAVGGQIFNAVLALVVRLIPFILIGLAAAALYRPSMVAVPAELWGELVQRHAPPGLFGLLVVGSIAGYMAALASMVNWAASYVMNDLYRLSIRPHATDREYVLAGRLLSAALLAAALFWGARIDPRLLERWVLFINSALVVFPLPLAWLKWFWWRTNVYGEMVGIAGAFPAGYLVWFGSDAALPQAVRSAVARMTGININGLIPAFGDLSRFPFWAGFGILFTLGSVAIIGTTLLTRPESPETLARFYLSVRPIGAWGPVRRALQGGAIEVPSVSRDIAACAWGVAFCLTMIVGFFGAAGGRFGIAAASGAIAALAGAQFARRAMGSRSLPRRAA